MSYDDLPDELLHSICEYLSPTEIYLLSEMSPSKALYHSLIGQSLSNNLGKILKGGRTDFKCEDPLGSFVNMVESLPSGSVCIR